MLVEFGVVYFKHQIWFLFLLIGCYFQLVANIQIFVNMKI